MSAARSVDLGGFCSTTPKYKVTIISIDDILFALSNLVVRMFNFDKIKKRLL